jgi:carboxyl-terminal processing protease
MAPSPRARRDVMRRSVIALAWLLCPAPLLAAPAPVGQSAAPATQAQIQAAARDYAHNLTQVVETIQRTYVREVSRVDLYEAALTGLYEAAQVPVPATLKAQLAKADKAANFDAVLIPARARLGNPEALQGHRAILASCRAMMRVLDPFSTVVTGLETTTSGFDQSFGLGLDLVEKAVPGPLVIKAVVPGGPAQRAGLQAGDRITRVDDKDPAKLTTEEALRLLNGDPAASSALGALPLPPPIPPPPGSDGSDPEKATPEVRLTVRSPGEKEARKVTLLRESFHAESVQGVSREANNSWNYWVDAKKKIAHIRVVTLSRYTAGELEGVLKRLDDDGLRGLILDLRWCPGGYLTSATGAASLFIEDGVVARTKVRTEGEQVYPAGGGVEQKFLHFPMVVLVNAETTGGGELIAAALQDHKRATVFGQRTRGKGSIQTPTFINLLGGVIATKRPDDDTLQLKLTNGTFLRPSGKNLNRFANSKSSDDWGIRPDAGMEFSTSAELSRRLKEWWHQQAVRPGNSQKALPLDDPAADPQRQAALKALRKIMAGKK